MLIEKSLAGRTHANNRLRIKGIQSFHQPDKMRFGRPGHEKTRHLVSGVVAGIGGHVIKTGCAPVLIDLMERGIVTGWNPQAEATFGTLPQRPDPELDRTLEDPARGRQSFAWFFGPSILYDTRFKIYGLTPDQHLKTLFIQDLLQSKTVGEKQVRL